ncbi:MAG: heavy-metal-associated domain-containing protein [Chloroherpetonaceae bacterium]
MKVLFFVLALFVFIGCGSEKKEAPKANVVKVSFKIDGMVCSSCEKSIESKLTKIDGVKSVNVSQEVGSADVEFDASKISAEKLIADISELGYKASIKSSQQ